MDSKIVSGADGAVVFEGPDAVRLFQATALRAALGLLSKGIQPRRGFTMKAGLAMARTYTGKSYPCTGRAARLALEDAREDLRVWCETMSAALPKEVADDGK